MLKSSCKILIYDLKTANFNENILYFSNGLLLLDKMIFMLINEMRFLELKLLCYYINIILKN